MAENTQSAPKKSKNIYRLIIKKLNNYRFTAMLVSIISLVAGIFGLLSFFLYHFAGDLDIYKIRQVGFQTEQTDRYLGMVLFFGCLFTVICSIFTVYNLIPALLNKEKIVPSKTPLIVGFAGTVFEIVVIVLMIKLGFNYDPVPNTQTAIAVSLPFGILSAIGTGLYLVPVISCSFFMPAIKVKK